MNPIKVIIDHIGRTVVGTVVNATESTLTMNNPVIIHVQPNPQTGQLAVNSYPYIFMEFIAEGKREQNNWTFNRNNIVESDVELDSKIIAQYQGVNTPPAPPPEAEVIRLFD